jgi:hypothetical protein
MPGKPGRSGGKREGAGRPVETFTLKAGAQYAISAKTADNHFLPMVLATVVEVDRKILVLELDNGDRLTIFR